jgi:predicted PurR-regulated permease PerM
MLPDDGLSAAREPLLHSSSRPTPGLRPARPSVFGADALSVTQQRVDQRIRTFALVLLSVAILGVGAFYLRAILVRFVLALALYYLLSPLIDVISLEQVAGCKRKPSRAVAILVALILTAGLLSLIGAVLFRCIKSFAAHADQYHGRVEQLFGKALDVSSNLGLGLPKPGNSTEVQAGVKEMMRHLNISHLIMELLGKAATMLENAIYILLFLAFLLAGSRPADEAAAHTTYAKANKQIYL